MSRLQRKRASASFALLNGVVPFSDSERVRWLVCGWVDERETSPGPSNLGTARKCLFPATSQRTRPLDWLQKQVAPQHDNTRQNLCSRKLPKKQFQNLWPQSFWDFVSG